MKLHFESTRNEEGFRKGQPLDKTSIRMTIDLTLFDDEEVEYQDQEDGSIMVKIKGIEETTRQFVLEMVENMCSYGDMKYKELEE